MTEKISSKIGIVGAGLVGCLAALAFAKKGYDVTLFEMRDDPRDEATRDKNLRSINLAVSDRGIRALVSVDEEMATRVLKDIIPMKGRMIHNLLGEQESQLYGLFGECINSIDRSYLNIELLNELDRNDNIVVLFNQKLTRADLSSEPKLIFVGPNGSQEYSFDFVIGSDGAHSQFRYQMQRYTRMNFSQEYVDTMYLELFIPAGENGTFSIDPNHLHIWPRHNFMLIALANKDGSFTSTFFAPWKVAESLDTDEKILCFFKENFSDAIGLIGEERLLKAFELNPKSSLVGVECSPYNVGGKAIILGDAAHSMVPFYGQGMNCGFEDVRILMELMEKNKGDTNRAFDEYSATRHEDLKAISQLAKDNYHEMSHKVTSKLFLFRKNVDYILGTLFKDSWLPLYTMISFRGDIPYSRAVKTAKKQERILNKFEYGFVALLAVGSLKAGKFLVSYLNRSGK